MLENQKIGGSRELFLPGKLVNFPKNHPDFGCLETNQRQNSELNFFVGDLPHMNLI